MKRSILLVASALVVFAAPASALSQDEIRACNAMAASFGPKKANFEAKTEERDALAAEAELSGEAWENAEALRPLSADYAAEADAALAIFEAAKRNFEAVEYALQSQGAQLNADFAAFNRKCTSE